MSIEAFEPGQVWEHTWDGNVTHYLILESLDVSKFRWTGSVPEPGFSILRLDDGQHYHGRSAPDTMKLFEFEEQIWESFIRWERLA